MDVTSSQTAVGGGPSGFSVVLAEKVLGVVRSLGLPVQWDRLGFGNLARRITAYTPAERIMAVLAGLACGLRGIAPGNLYLRTNSALQQATGGSFPDQGTIHRWLGQITDEQAAGLRAHLHQVVRDQGRFWNLLRAGGRLFVDIDGQGLVARGQRFERAEWGWLGAEMDRGYQRYVAYAGQTREVLDELLRPGSSSLLTALPEVVAGLNEIFPREQRSRVVLRADAHGGTVNNLHAVKTAGSAYVFRLSSRAANARLRREVQSLPRRACVVRDSLGNPRQLDCWDLPEWEFGTRTEQPARSRVVVFHERTTDGHEHWLVLLTDLTDLTPEQLWVSYHERGGTIEEYNDQSERAFHLDIVRTGHAPGHAAVLVLAGLCWNLTEWAVEELQLPPTNAPGADRSRWVRAAQLDRSVVQERAALSGLHLSRAPHTGRLEVEDTLHSPESRAWLCWLGAGFQIRLHLAA